MVGDIKEKINIFLMEDRVFERECEVVYFFVEVRKILENKKMRENFKVLNFYCDWTVHPRKDKTSEIQEILHELKEDHLKDVNFAHMERLKEDLHNFSKKIGILDVTEDKNLWNKLVLTFTRVLSDQPIIIGKEEGEEWRVGEIKSFCYKHIKQNSTLVYYSLEYIDQHGESNLGSFVSGRITRELAAALKKQNH